MTLIPIVIESPYSGDIVGNITYARRCMVDALSRGEAPFACHLLYTQIGILNDSIERERKLGTECGNRWAHFAHYTAFYTDLGWSAGMLDALYNRCRFGKFAGLQSFVLRALEGPVKYPPNLSEEMLNLLRHHDGDRFRRTE